MNQNVNVSLKRQTLGRFKGPIWLNHGKTQANDTSLMTTSGLICVPTSFGK